MFRFFFGTETLPANGHLPNVRISLMCETRKALGKCTVMQDGCYQTAIALGAD